jgi:hypothetical protein
MLVARVDKVGWTGCVRAFFLVTWVSRSWGHVGAKLVQGSHKLMITMRMPVSTQRL